MTTDADKFWGEISRRLQRAMNMHVPSIEDAQAELDAAESVPLSEGQIDSIIAAANAYEGENCQENLSDDVSAFASDDEVPVLNRNPGKADADTDQAINDARRQAFGKSAGGKSRFEWLLEQQQLEKVAEQAEELLDSMDINAAPINPLRIAEDESPLLCVQGGDFRDRFDGQLEYHRSRDQFLLLFNTKYDASCPPGQNHPRTRFSLAHELAHYFIESHREYLTHGGKPHGSKSEFVTDTMTEREADAFAAALLMPSKLMRPEVNQEELTPERISEISALFQTSFLSTAIRAVQMSDFPCALVGVRDGTVTWRFMSRSLIEAGFYPKPKGKISSPTTQAAWTAFADHGTASGTGEGIARHWFEVYEKHDLATISVAEHYSPIPVMGLLLVLLTMSEDDLHSDDDEDYGDDD